MDLMTNPRRLRRYIFKRLFPLALVALVVTFVAAFWSVLLAVICFILLSLVSFCEFLLFKKAFKKDILAQVKGLLSNAKNIADRSMTDLPFPAVVIKLDGSVYWYNEQFYVLASIDGHEIFGENLSSLFPSFEFVRLLSKSETSLLFKHNCNKYEAFVEPVYFQTGSNESLVMLYLLDRTEEFVAKQALIDKSLVECIIVVDNYDEVLKETSDNEQAATLGEIGNKITAWVSEYSGVVRKYERDKYFVLFENINFEKALESRFNILDVVRTIELDDKIAVTLSIGVGAKGDTILESDKFARVALDMALGRGGDQAVIKNGNNFDFYGAKTREFEKRTKVKVRVVAHALKGLITQSDKVIIMGHKDADMDSLGASVGLLKIAKLLGKDGYVVDNQGNDKNKYFETIFKEDNKFKEFVINGNKALEIFTANTLLIVVDTHKPDVVEYPDLLTMANNIVLIDHHRRSAEFLDSLVLSHHEPYASSTCEMVTEIFQYIEPGRLSVAEAEALYAGIVVDTKNFSVKTGARTFEAACYLKRAGADISNVKKLFQSTIDDFIKKAKIESNVQVYRGVFAISQFRTSDKSARLIAAKAADELLGISGIEASFVLVEANGNVVISGRSGGDVNVQVILERLGGGGHMNIAGAQVNEGRLENVMVALCESIDTSIEDK